MTTFEDTNDMRLHAAHGYINKRFLNRNEFDEDFARFRYITKLFTRARTKTDDVQIRLILNHLILLFNVFETSVVVNILLHKLHEDSYPTLKIFLIYLNRLQADVLQDVPVDHDIFSQLAKL